MEIWFFSSFFILKRKTSLNKKKTFDVSSVGMKKNEQNFIFITTFLIFNNNHNCKINKQLNKNNRNIELKEEIKS